MSGWANVLSDIEHRHPFLTRLDVCGAENYSSPLPAVIQTSIDIADGLLAEEEDFKRLAMIFPLLLDCPEWIAVGCSLACYKKRFPACHRKFGTFFAGPKIAIRWQICCRIRKGRKCLRNPVLMGEDGRKKRKAGQTSPDTKKGCPKNQRLRFQPVTETQKEN